MLNNRMFVLSGIQVNSLVRFPLLKYSRTIALFHKSYTYVELGNSKELANQCQCYADNLNDLLPADTKLDVNISLPRKIPEYHKHLLLISPENTPGADPEWKSAWQRNLELNPVWPYSAISDLKKCLKDTKEGQEILVNAISLKDNHLTAESDNKDTAQFLAIPEMKVYTIHKQNIEKFATYIGGGKLNVEKSKRVSFEDYLKGADVVLSNSNIKKETAAFDSVAKIPKFDGRDYLCDLFLVCGHYQRDQRCGMIAPELIDKLRVQVNPKVRLGIISHIGGHKYAGNVIFYNVLGKDKEGKPKVDGLWFGKILPDTIHALLSHLKDGKIISDFYRGGISTRN